MGWYRKERKNSWGAYTNVYRTKRDSSYCKKKVDYDIRANDKLIMLGILFIAGFRTFIRKGVIDKEIKIFLEENPERHDFLDFKKIERTYYKISIDRKFNTYERKIRERSKRKSQTVKV